MKALTRKDLPANATFRHSAYCRGYVSRKIDRENHPAEPYKGRYGKGYVVYAPSWETSQYKIKEYHIV